MEFTDMPNWCSNVVTLSHSDIGQIERARDAFVNGCLLQTFHPCPDDLKDTTSPSTSADAELIAKHGYDNWYDWCVNNWGTKWDVDSEGASVDDYPIDGNSITLGFDSAWSPPLSWYSHMEDLGWSVDAYYYEPGMEFCGHYVEGDNNDYAIEGDAEWVVDNIPDDIDAMFNISASMEEYDEDGE